MRPLIATYEVKLAAYGVTDTTTVIKNQNPI
jgi:hypothetical protein